MLCFIIPIKSAQISSSWELVSKLFERTIKSVCNQTIPNFRVIVVCHERPNLEFTHPNITYVEVDLPIPIRKDSIDHSSRRTDKQKKVFIGLIHARQFNPTHIMFVDADDCVSKHLAELVKQNTNSNGWILRRGYEYKEGSKLILHRRKEFHQKCGTGYIVRHDLVAPDEHMKLEDIGQEFLFHQCIEGVMRKQGYSLEDLPFEGAVYITENGANMTNQKDLHLKMLNHSYEKLLFYVRRYGKLFFSRPLTNSMREEFGIYDVC